MSNESPNHPRRRRGRRASEPYADFYASYYGLDEPSGPRTRHRAAASRTGAVLLAGLSALMHRRVVVVLTLGLSVFLVLAVGVMASATRTGSDQHHAQSLVDTTGSPTDQPVVPVAEGSTSHPAPPSSSATRTSSSPLITTPGNLPVYAPPPAGEPVGEPVVVPTTSQAAPPPSIGGGSTQPAPSIHHSPPPSSTSTSAPPPPTSSSPSPSPTPSPTKKCLIPDPLHPGKCILFGT